MKNPKNIFIFSYLLQLIILSQCFISIESVDVLEITEAVPDNDNYKKKEFDFDSHTLNHYFKYNFDQIPGSKISAFRFEFDKFNDLSREMNRVFCTFVDSGTNDEELVNIVNLLTNTTSSCIGAFNENGVYDGIIKHDESKKRLAIYLVTLGYIDFTGRVYLRVKEKQLEVNEKTVMEDESYSLVPFAITISHFREYASKILIYSYTRELQMFYTEESTPYPEKLFFGNIMSVYTNPNMVRQKYKNADTMVLLTKNFGQPDMVGEEHIFQVKFFASNYLLDYYMSNNLEGRSKNTPLAINMTECANPYYVILNYNKPEKQVSLYIDEIYGKIKSLAVAPTLTRSLWEEMLENDMVEIDKESKKFILPKDSASHIDVYKIECDIPLLLNFYYIDENAAIPDLDYGNVVITTLRPYSIVSLPFAADITVPELTIEVFNPVALPSVLVIDGQDEKMVTQNSLMRSILLNTNKPIILKERNGDSNTRVIIKVGYPTSSWTHISDYVIYNGLINMYVFYFPPDADKYNYTSALLETSGTNSDDNVKYCYATNIGSAILPSSENCYRVSELNSYTIKVLNPLIMHKEYELNEDLNYYVSLKPTGQRDQFNVKVNLISYDTKERNVESIPNSIVLNGGKESTILTAPERKDEYVLVQIHSCDNSKLNYGIFNGYDLNQQIVSDTEIPAGTKHYYNKFKNIFLETEVKLTGNSGSQVFVKHTGISDGYTPRIKSNYQLSFNEELNQLIMQNPLETSERMRYTVLVDRSGVLSSKGLTLCSFAEMKDSMAAYVQTFVSFDDKPTLNIKFNKIGLNKGDTFEAIVFIEQEPNSRLAFLTDILTGKVGEIAQKSIIEIKDSFDDENVYISQTIKSDDLSFYYSYLPSQTFEVPVGAFRVELDDEASGEISRVYCAFADENDDPNTMVEAVEDIILESNSYCIGGRSKTNGKIYNYFFKYSYTKEKTPRRLVLKLNNFNANGGFKIYIRKVENIFIERTDFSEEREYGKQEEFKKTIMPYIIDLEKIRPDDTEGYISKILIFSQHLEMQMYYLDKNEERNDPIILFTGNIMLVYTKLALAEQKYHTTKLILLSENLNGQEHSAIGNQFRFHTKMYESSAQVEYFVSNSPGRPINRPLSIEMNTCSSTNNKYYFILNYNMPEGNMNLYLDLVYGNMRRARTIKEINNQKWGSFINSDLEDISDYYHALKPISQHIDVIEVECNTPLLINVYYNTNNTEFDNEDIVVKYLKPGDDFKFERYFLGKYYFTLSVFNPKENPFISFSYDNKSFIYIQENSLQIGMLYTIPYSIYLSNRGSSYSRVIFKLGYNPDSEWIDEKENIAGTLFSSEGSYIYKFPASTNKRNFTSVVLDVKPMKKDSEEILENVKFCYSTSIGMPIDITPENCYRTGANIPYSLTFINPLIAPKNYKSISDSYYVTISPYTSNEYISLGITENKYETNERNIEGINKIIELETDLKSTILTLPELVTNRIIVQLQVCKAQIGLIRVANKNAFTGETISSRTITTDNKFYYYEISDILMETELEFNGNPNDTVFVKHSGISDYTISLGTYYASFIEEENTVNIYKPIKDESFRFTVLVGEKGAFENFTLCDFAEKKESQYSELADYVNTFVSVSSNVIPHYIDFRSFRYEEGQEFDLLVYAVQMENSKLELLYPVISGKVGEIKGITEIKGVIDGNYVYQDFVQNKTNNYLFYDFALRPVGDVASLRIYNENGGSKVNKVGCAFVQTGSTDIDMVNSVNIAVRDGKNACIGQTSSDQNGFDALVSAIDTSVGKMRLVIQVIYGVGEEEKNEKISDEEGPLLTIKIRNKGVKVSAESSQYNEKEDLTIVPYVINLEEIRAYQTPDYISKVMVYSNTREMQMYYIGNSGAPTELFSGNIMLVYTNKDVIDEKYQGAKIMILLTNSLSKPPKPVFDEQFRFKTYFFKSDNTMQYYVSANPDGRLLNNPTSLEMPSCDVPYYYILNYNEPEEDDRILHIDNVFGEINAIKMSNELNKNDWYELVNSMKVVEGNEYNIEGQIRFHIDVIEFTCKLPTLVNIYYTDNANPKVSDLDQGDISILEINPSETVKLSFKSFLQGEFIYSFNVDRGNNNDPNILVKFSDDEEMPITKNGLFTKNSNKNYGTISIQNKELSGSTKTKVIFKFGYNVESIFTKLDNNVYHLKTENDNLYAYKFNTGADRLNTTSINFTVSTTKENVKFCYITNLGAFIDPSLQNCYRVGRVNPYTIVVLNPYLMYKDYYIQGEEKNEIMDYYVAFRTVDPTLDITITPALNNYTTPFRNTEGYGSSLTINEIASTVLTSPKNNYLFIQMDLCTEDVNIMYEFYNAYNHSNLNENGEIFSGSKNYYRNIKNILLDTELVLKTNEKNSPKLFVRHAGVDELYRPIVNEMKIEFDNKKDLSFNQPIEDEEFTYTILLDKRGILRRQNYNLCSFIEISKLAHYTQTVKSSDETVHVELDFSQNALKEYKQFDLLILADNGKMMILSDIFESHEESSNLVLIIILIILAVLLVAGAILAFIFLRKYKAQPDRKKIDAKETSLAEVDNKNEPMMTSSVAAPNDQ